MLSNQILKKDTIVSNAYGSAFSILANEYIKKDEKIHLIITEDSQQAYKIYKEIQYLTKNSLAIKQHPGAVQFQVSKNMLSSLRKKFGSPNSKDSKMIIIPSETGT